MSSPAFFTLDYGLVLLAVVLGVVIASDSAGGRFGSTSDVLTGIFGLINDSHRVYPFRVTATANCDDRATSPRWDRPDSHPAQTGYKRSSYHQCCANTGLISEWLSYFGEGE